jgi:Ca-activated chloride channel homolog
MFARKFSLALVACLLLAGLASAQGPKKDVGAKAPLPPGISEAPRTDDDDGSKPKTSLAIDVDLVTVDVVVTNKNNDPIQGLDREHFRIFDNNVEQTITNFAPTDAPLTVVVLVEFGDTFGYYADDVVSSAAGFISSLRDDDWGALVAYDIRPEILTDFTKDKNALMNGLRRLRTPAYRETSLYDAVYDTLERLDGVDGKKAIFLLSTGLDTLSKHNYPDVLKKAEASDTVIYPVSMGQMARLYYEQQFGPETNIQFLQADNVLRSLADASGGTAFYPRFAGEYRGIYETVSTHVRNQYSLGFVPKDLKNDGKLHKIRVDVAPLDVNKDGKPDQLKARHRKGYYAPRS